MNIASLSARIALVTLTAFLCAPGLALAQQRATMGMGMGMGMGGCMNGGMMCMQGGMPNPQMRQIVSMMQQAQYLNNLQAMNAMQAQQMNLLLYQLQLVNQAQMNQLNPGQQQQLLQLQQLGLNNIPNRNQFQMNPAILNGMQNNGLMGWR